MIITCTECSTNFNLDEKLIRKEGSKACCCVCDSVFTIYPPEQPLPMGGQPVEAASGRPLERPSMADTLTLDLNEIEDSLIALDEPELEIEEMAFDDDQITEETASYKVPPARETVTQTGIDETPPVRQPTESIDPVGDNDGFSLELGIEEVKEEGFFELDQEVIDQNVEPDSQLTLENEPEEDFGLEELSQAHLEVEDFQPEPDDFPAIEQDDEAVPPPLPASRKREPIKDHLPVDFETRPTMTKGSGSIHISKPVIGLIILVILCGAAYTASIMTGFKIPVIQTAIENLSGSKPPAALPVVVVPDEASVKGDFVTNQTAGNLFVISGTIINDSKTSVGNIVVKATLTTKGDVITRSKEVYGANTIQDSLLKTGSIEAIDRILLKKPAGKMTWLKPGGRIPFTAVFSNLPENLDGFSVEVKSFDEGGK